MKRVACFFWLAFQASHLCAADQYEYRRLFLQFQKATGLPCDVLNYIATFIVFDDRETDEEFVARAAALKTIKQQHKEAVVDLKMPEQLGFTQDSALMSYAVEGKKIYRFRGVDYVDSGKSLTMRLISVALDPEIAFIRSMLEFNKNFTFQFLIHCFAISRDEKQWAQLRMYPQPSSDSGSTSNGPQLCYKTSNDNNDPMITIPNNYSLFQSIAFNKQGTKIIMFATHNSLPEHAQTCADGTFYHIFSVASEDEHAKKSKITLLGYFQQLIAKFTE